MKVGILRIAALAALGVASLAGQAQAVVGTYNWDPNVTGGTNQGGAGTWNATSSNWATLSTSSDSTWSNTGAFSAIFGGTSAGAVTLGSSQNAANLFFNTNGYTLSSSTLTLSGSISVAPGAIATINPTLAFSSASADLDMVGGGTASLGAKLIPSASGAINIGAGTLVLAQTSGSINFNNGGVLNGNLVVSSSGVRVNFNSLVGSTSSASPSAVYSGNGTIQIQGNTAILSNTSGTFGGTIGTLGGGLQVQLNSLNLPFNKFDVTQSTPAYPVTNAFAVAIGATKYTVGSTSFNGYLQINAPISGNSDVEFTSNSTTSTGGGGVTLLNVPCTYTGATMIEGNGGTSAGYTGGSLILGCSNALPIGTDVEFGDINHKPTNTPTIDLNGFNQQIGSLSSYFNAITYAATQSFYIANNNVGTVATLTVSGNTTPSYAFTGYLVDHSNPTGGTLALVKDGTNTLTLAGTSASNTYSGGTTVAGGVLKLGNSSALGTGGLTTTGGSVDLNANSISLPSLNGMGGTITNSGSAADSTLTINLVSGSSFGGALTDGALHKVALKVTGAGVLTLTGSSSNYSGGTVLNSGTIILANSAGSALGLGDLTLNGGTLASDPGSFSGSLIAGSSAHTVAPGGLGSIGTLVLGGSASLNGNSTLAFDIADSSSDQLQIGGTLSISSPVTLDINTSGTLSGNYTLATYGNSPAVVAGDFNLGTELPVSYALDVTSTQLSLVAVPEPSTVALALAGAVLGLLGYARRRRARKSLDC